MAGDQITKEQARVILENYLVQKAKTKAKKLEIKDNLPDEWDDFYYPDELKDCFFISFTDDNHFYIGGIRMIAISKKTGEIIADCVNPGKKYSLFFS